MTDQKTKERILFELIGLAKKVLLDDESAVVEEQIRKSKNVEAAAVPQPGATSSPPKTINSTKLPKKKVQSPPEQSPKKSKVGGKIMPKALDAEIIAFIKERGRVRVHEVADAQNHGRSATYMLLKRLVQEKQLRQVKDAEGRLWFEPRPFAEKSRSNGAAVSQSLELN